MELKKLVDLDPKEYEHPFDKKALDALHGTKGLDTLVKKFYEYGVGRSAGTDTPLWSDFVLCALTFWGDFIVGLCSKFFLDTEQT